ncbi:MAG: hypothetical protein LBG97_01250 [Coriobacteriales bacterium]|nr:hypothetical protein [Coriobacteriales bacterium]
MIDQVTLFLENSKGRLADACRVLADAGVSMHTLVIAETTDYGVVRIITNKPNDAINALQEAGFRARLTKVHALSIVDEAGGLASLLETFNAAGINLEYAYCFSTNKGYAIDIVRVDDPERLNAVAAEFGLKLLSPQDLYEY